MDFDGYIECGIKYKVIKKDANQYILYPTLLVVGGQKDYNFVSNVGSFPVLADVSDLENDYVVSSIYLLDELEVVLGFDDVSDSDFIINYFYEIYKNTLLYVKTCDNKIVINREIDLDIVGSEKIDMTYFFNNDIPAIALNDGAIDDLLKSNDINNIKLKLKYFKEKLLKFKDDYRPDGVTKIFLSNGKVSEIELDYRLDDDNDDDFDDMLEDDIDYNTISDTNKEVSYNGLRNFIKDHIKGHDKEIDTFAQKLYMNYTVLDGEATESILLVGPTGTGKTETVNAACSYLDIPFITVNASNLVPNGYKGMCLEDVLFSLYGYSNNDLGKAERGLVFLDEIDKLKDSELELKAVIKNILLTFNGGGCFPIHTEKQDIVFNSSMTNKIYAGVFDRIKTKKGATLGFNNEDNNLITYKNIRQKIVDKNYFSLEELSRISTILMFDELSNDVKKEILLYSKLSELSKKTARYKRQFGIDLVYDDDFIDAIIDSVPKNEGGMRTVNNLLKDILNVIERKILECDECNYKKLVLTRDTVLNSNNFDLS